MSHDKPNQPPNPTNRTKSNRAEDKAVSQPDKYSQPLRTLARRLDMFCIRLRARIAIFVDWKATLTHYSDDQRFNDKKQWVPAFGYFDFLDSISRSTVRMT
jgi:hypothetical protein